MRQQFCALNHVEAEVYELRYQRAKEVTNNFANGYDNNQISIHSAVGMLLGEVVEVRMREMFCKQQ